MARYPSDKSIRQVVVDTMPHPPISEAGDADDAQEVTVLACGHWLYPSHPGPDLIGQYRRCVKCEAQVPPDAKEGGD